MHLFLGICYTARCSLHLKKDTCSSGHFCHYFPPPLKLAVWSVNRGPSFQLQVPHSWNAEVALHPLVQDSSVPKTGPSTICVGHSSPNSGRICGKLYFSLCPVFSGALMFCLHCEEPAIPTLKASRSSCERYVKSITELELSSAYFILFCSTLEYYSSLKSLRDREITK